MLFNSFGFLLFFPLVFFIYWFVVNRNLHVRNLFLIAASYVFYGWWDWRFLSLIVLSSFTDYLTALYIHKSEGQHRKYWLWLSLGVNLGLLGFFKYYNFFVDSFIEAFSIFGLELNSNLIKQCKIGLKRWCFLKTSLLKTGSTPFLDYISFQTK